MKFSHQVRHFIRLNTLIKHGDKIVVGISGGVDSVVLAHFLLHEQHELGIQIILAHYNHNLRKSALKDQEFVQKLAEKWNVPLEVGEWKHKDKMPTGSVEEKARQKRLAFFQKIVHKRKASAVALAHTKDDLAETTLMRIVRGTGLSGLRAILPARTLEGIRYIRPLLGVSKDQIQKYAKSQKLAYREDPTNRQKIYFRNKVRLELLPFLKKYNTNINETLTNLANTVGVDYDFLEEEGKQFFDTIVKSVNAKKKHISLTKLAGAHPAIQRYIVRRCVQSISQSPYTITLKHTQEIEDLMNNRPQNSVVHLTEAISVKKLKNTLEIARK